MPTTPLHREHPSPLLLFLSFFRLGLTAFGGPAMVAYIREMAVRHNWLSPEDFKQGVASCQTIPGATAIQTAAYVGLRAGGPWGATAAYIGFGMPAFILMVVLSALYQRGHGLPIVISIFAGLQVIVVAMVTQAAITFGRATLKNWRDIGLGLIMAALLLAGANPLLVILLAALAGLLLFQKTMQTTQRLPSQPGVLAWRELRLPLLLTLALILGMGVLVLLDRQLLDLALIMVRVDFFAFGGGYASVPLLFNEVVTFRHWMSAPTFMDGMALGQVTPGPIDITATIVGFIRAGLIGAIVATTAIFAPSLIFLTAAVPSFDRFRHNAWFQRAMHGILVSFTGLLLSISLRFALTIAWDSWRVGIAAVVGLALWRRIDLLWIVVAGITASALLL